MAARCPICTQELEDAKAVRHHAQDVHGVPATAEWSSMPGPGEQAGWYQDPWNASALRFWEGNMWSGKTAARGTVPEGPTPTEKPKRHWLRLGKKAPAPAPVDEPAAAPSAPVPFAQEAPSVPAEASPALAPGASEAARPASTPAAALATIEPPTVEVGPVEPQNGDGPSGNGASAADTPTNGAAAPDAHYGNGDSPAAPPPPMFDPWGPPVALMEAVPGPPPAEAPAPGAPDVVPEHAADAEAIVTPAVEDAALVPAEPEAEPEPVASIEPEPVAVEPDPEPDPEPTASATEEWAPAGPAPDQWAAGGPATEEWAPAEPVVAVATAPPAETTPVSPPPNGAHPHGPPPTGPEYAPPVRVAAPPSGPPVAPATYLPPAPAVATATGPLGAPSKRPSPKALALIGGGVALALVVLVLIAVASSHHVKRVTAGPPPSTAAPTTTAAPGPVNLSAGVLTQQDLGGAWVATAPLTALTSGQLSQGPCGSPLWAHDVAGYLSRFHIGTGVPGHTAFIASEVREAVSQDVADSQASLVTSSSYAPCLHDALELEVQLAFHGTGLTVDDFAMDPLPLDANLDNKQSYVASIAFSDNSGDSGVITVDYVELFENRYEGILEIITPQGLGIDRDALIQAQSERMVERLDALPPGGTLASRSV